MKIRIPNIENNFRGFEKLSLLNKKAEPLFIDEITLDFSSCNFFEANMSAPLYAILSKVRDNLNDVSIQNLSNGTEKILRKNKFLSFFNYSPIKDSNQTTLPFKIFKMSNTDHFNDYLENHMRGKGIPVMSKGLTKRFRKSLFEIFLNAIIHSQSGFGIFVCGQFFPKKHKLDFSIADSGIGIRDNVRNYLKNQNISSKEAIIWALTEGHTTKTGPHPGGLGLKLIKEFIDLNKGKIQIISNGGYYEYSSKSEKIKEMKYDFPGTCVNIEINTEDSCSYYLKSELKSGDIF